MNLWRLLMGQPAHLDSKRLDLDTQAERLSQMNTDRVSKALKSAAMIEQLAQQIQVELHRGDVHSGHQE